MGERLLCMIGLHWWKRSKFVALCHTRANLVCVRCHAQKDDGA